jgi:hypothetical protein
MEYFKILRGDSYFEIDEVDIAALDPCPLPK